MAEMNFVLFWMYQNKKDLEALVCRINKCLEEYNKCGAHLYKLEFSMGYAVYDYKTHKCVEEFYIR